MNYLKKLWHNHQEIIKMKKEMEEKEKIERQKRHEEYERQHHLTLYKEVDSLFNELFGIIKVASYKVFSKIHLGVFCTYEQNQVLAQLEKNMELFIKILSADHQFFKECDFYKQDHHSSWRRTLKSDLEKYIDRFNVKKDQTLSDQELLVSQIDEAFGECFYKMENIIWALTCGKGKKMHYSESDRCLISDHSQEELEINSKIVTDMQLLSQILGVSYTLFRKHFYTAFPNAAKAKPKAIIAYS